MKQPEAVPVASSDVMSKKSTGETFSFYLTVINQCVDLILKLSPVFMLGAGIMLWSFLREIGWTNLLLPTASSPSGLSFLAISALAFIGVAILIFLTPSLFFSSGFDFYEGKLTPRRVKWILVTLAVLWTILFAAIGLVDGLSQKFSVTWAFLVLYVIGIFGYALPGLSAACEAWEKRSGGGQGSGSSDDESERLWRSVFLEHWLTPSAKDDDSGEPIGELSVGSKRDPNKGLEGSNRKEHPWFAWVRPFLVVFMALAAVVATSSPVLVLIRLWGDQLEATVGAIPAFVIILVCGGLAVLPAFTYLHTRSQNVSSVVAAKCASVAAGGLVLFSLFAMMYAPIRDRVFHLLDIQSSQKEYFLISSPVATQALQMLGFPVAVMPATISDWSHNSSSWRQQTGSLAKSDAPMLVQAWVGYSFGDTVLLCRWRVGDRVEQRDKPFRDVRSKDNVCLPLARSELRRLSDVWPNNSWSPENSSYLR